jgi:GAF domain-containing protein
VEFKRNDEIGNLAEAFNKMTIQLRGVLTNLEERVAERTEALSRKTSQLQATAQIARQATAIQDTAILLNDTVRLISNQFGFYHAGIFLVDQNMEYAVLQAASSEGGQRMLTRGHSLRIGSQGIVGFVAAQNTARIALDTGVDAVYFNNPDLPTTRSEAALPLTVRGTVIGVLDIQSEQPQAFTSENVETFQTLADQIALSIENARLFEEMNLAVKQLEQAASQRAREAWNRIARTRGLAYQYTPLGIQPAIQGSIPTPETGQLAIPITLHNQKIGEIRVKRKEDAGNWDPREKAMLAEISTQVAQALENARLLDDAQQRAMRERAIAEITARIGAVYDVDAVLRVTAQEIGKAISDSEVTVQIRARERETT